MTRGLFATTLERAEILEVIGLIMFAPPLHSTLLLWGLGLFSPADFGNLPLMDSAAPNQQQILDNEHLRLLSVFHYVKGGITALFACIPIIHVVIGLVFILAPQIFGHGKDQPPAFLGWLFVILGSSFILLGSTFAALVLVAGRCISRRKHYTFCFVMACVECLSVPFGTVLGIRPQVDVGPGIRCCSGRRLVGPKDPHHGVRG